MTNRPNEERSGIVRRHASKLATVTLVMALRPAEDHLRHRGARHHSLRRLTQSAEASAQTPRDRRKVCPCLLSVRATPRAIP